MTSNPSFAMERRSSSSLSSSPRRSPLLKSTMPSSPHPMSPLLRKSPMPKSPVRYETYKSRCARCLLGFFRFRPTHSKKLISDSRNASSRRYEDDGQARNKIDRLPSVDGKCDCTTDTEGGNPRTSAVKEVQKSKGDNVKSDFKSIGSRTKRHKKRRRARRLPLAGCYDVATMGFGKRDPPRLTDRSSKKEEESTVTAISRSKKDPSPLKEINLHVHLNEAAEAFISRSLADGQVLGEDDGKIQSKHFLDALDVLNSNRDLFAKLLQDPNSLLVKHIEDLRDSQQKGSGLVNEPLETIVVLKPDMKSLENHADVHNNNSSSVGQLSLRSAQSVRPLLSPFGQMKRMFMKALGPNRKPQLSLQAHCPERKAIQWNEECNEETRMENAETNFSGETSLAEVQANDKRNRLRKLIRDMREESVSTSSSSYKNKSSTVVLLKKQRTKTWDGICYVDEFDSLHTVGIRGKRELGFVTPQMRTPPHRNSQMAQESKWRNQRGMECSWFSPQRQNMEASPRSDSKRSFEILEVQPNIPDGISADEGNEDASAGNYIHLPSNACASPDVESNLNFENASSTRRVSGTDGLDTSEIQDCIDTPRTFDSLRPVSPIENQASMSSEAGYMSSPPLASRIGVLDKMEDKAEQPSPVSVLEQFFTEDISSPISKKSCSDLTIQCRFEEKYTSIAQSPALNADTCLEEHRCMFDYIALILHAAVPSWDDLLLRCYWSDEFLLENVLDEVDISLCNDRILFEYVNEILLGAYHHGLRLAPWLSSMKSKILPVSVAEYATQEVMKYIDWSLLLQPPMETLEEFIAKDLFNSRTWTDNKGEADDIIIDAAEGIIQDLIIDLIQL